MCGIVGIVGQDAVADGLIEALRRLEYRGYDSAGIATLEHGRLERRRAEGKLVNLRTRLEESPLTGTIGIGHTRWATHGRPNETNAHPHATARLAVVHNGIIENFRELKAELQGHGVRFESETDTEVVAQLVSHLMDGGLDPVAAVAAALPRLRGAFALGFVFAGHDDLLIGARHGAPLAIGFGQDKSGGGETYLGSDALALAPFTEEITYLEEGDWAVLSRAGAEIHDLSGAVVLRERQRIVAQAFRVEKGNHRHFMGKEIHEQPEVVGRTLAHYVDLSQGRVALPEALPFDFRDLSRLSITACGTAYYAGLVAKYWFEKLARLPVEIDVASEARYREPPLERDGLTLVISQSGETADTLASLRYAKAQGQHTLAVVNVPTSTIAREASAAVPTLAGPEIGVASTKAFSCQLTVLLCLAIAAGRARGTLSAEAERGLVDALITVPGLMADALQREGEVEGLAREIAKARDVLYLGRGTAYPMALEGALKLKEISYIHAEGYAAGELKHGPIALIDESVPVIVIAPHDAIFEKTVSNMQEVAARGGRIILIGDAKGAAAAGLDTMATVTMPDLDPVVAPIVYAVPIQLIAYHTAVFMGKDVDQPRNLAKSVTVE
ncbi:glutamine--fructose-6-phosphate transaminase (isomerizing) [Methylobacterium iners]|uniref:Glutamine--fructose-6-phosphate aminotransferase [isomerizing] n=1 Tax=Methylobacterium iners TaxID=418707 RepID=A0ABQ4RX37_9HYPH|nr:glutamine--fructose-6-phosphate transaminase (isomerizing) [Methylobacterium iners]GJD94532.1 Glutamine--fructose-6-phosphate aminotransferase [isomerizing] [Methylobacterium iners]